MNRTQINQQLANSRLDKNERERLLQHLHYLNSEGIDGTPTNTRARNNTTSNNSRTRAKHKPKTKHKPQ